MRLLREQSGQALVEWAIAYAGIILPLTAAIIFTAQLLWIWHGVSEFTRQGAHYAATHCWQGAGDNVTTYMRAHVPPMIDQEQFRSGQVDITVQYFSKNADTGEIAEFTCDDAECTTACIPDLVTVQVKNYEFRRFVTALRLPGVPIPDFRTTVPMESAGCDPEQGACLP